MAQATSYKRTLAVSVGSGVKSVIGDNGRRFYILEHKVSSKYHKAGEAQRIIVDEIEIGRDPRCQVRFDEEFSTVSRRHAAIVRDGDNWKLVQLSKTNSTYLNGHKVEKEWYLQNGDEIQLSTNGPKLGFIAPAGDKGLVKSIGMTARLSLFRQQALRPYKTAVSILAACLIIGCGIGAFYLHKLYEKNKEQSELISLNEKRHAEALAVQDSLLTQATSEREKLSTELTNLKSQFG
ncbi:MAG: FHA domain-containing protein, partial [Muribaculaceae bacterium]|nr:FHA domain-containing protein [Muribaculaceae bacterium]